MSFMKVYILLTMKVSHPRVVYCNCVKFISSFPLVYEEMGLQDI